MKCHGHHRWMPVPWPGREERVHWECQVCFEIRDEVKSRMGRNNRRRGTAAELDVARLVGGRKVGPLGLPWDVEVGTFRLQVRDLSVPPSLRRVVKALDAIRDAPGEGTAGYVWIEPGRGGEQLVIMRLKDWVAQ